MGGDLRVTSKRGARLDIPSDGAGRIVPMCIQPQNGTQARVRCRRVPLSILCAEDNPYGRVVMNTILRELGHRVDFVETGEAAVEAVTRGAYDAVLMDVTLSGLSGLEADAANPCAAGQGRADAGGCDFRVMTGAAMRKPRATAGVNYYFVKPVSPAKVGAGARQGSPLEVHACCHALGSLNDPHRRRT